MDSEKEYKDLYHKYIKRKGADTMLLWLEGTDFFKAPASTRYHESYEGGLAEHSVNVFWEMTRLMKAYPEVGKKTTPESVAIISLLHDICKADCYTVEMRNKKDESGRWIQVPFYAWKEQFVYGGHGSKSVYLIQSFMDLKEEEAVAINCHMGGTDVAEAHRAFPLAFLAHTADMAATIPAFARDAGGNQD